MVLAPSEYSMIVHPPMMSTHINLRLANTPLLRLLVDLSLELPKPFGSAPGLQDKDTRLVAHILQITNHPFFS